MRVTPYPFGQSLTVDDWFVLPDDGNRYELLQGMLVLLPWPGFEHQDAVGCVTLALYDAAARSGGRSNSGVGVVLSPRTAFMPDAIYISPERLHLIRKRGLEGAPDLVVEVTSPETGAFDEFVKLPLYFKAGVREAWLVDVDARTVTVHTSPGESRSCAFGEPIPSGVVDVGSAGLEDVIQPPE